MYYVIPLQTPLSSCACTYLFRYWSRGVLRRETLEARTPNHVCVRNLFHSVTFQKLSERADTNVITSICMIYIT